MSKFIITYKEYGSDEPPRFMITEAPNIDSLKKYLNESFGETVDVYSIDVYLVANTFKTKILKELVISEV